MADIDEVPRLIDMEYVGLLRKPSQRRHLLCVKRRNKRLLRFVVPVDLENPADIMFGDNLNHRSQSDGFDLLCALCRAFSEPSLLWQLIGRATALSNVSDKAPRGELQSLVF